jgi:hypothetical protein
LSYLQLGRESLALAAFDRLIERYPRSTTGYLEKGKLLVTMPHRHDEGRAILEQAGSIGGRPYTQLDADAVLPKILDNVLDQLFKEFDQANRAFVIFREGTSGRLVVKASRIRWPQDEDTAQAFLSDERRINAICACLDDAGAFCDDKRVRDDSYCYGFLVMCAPVCDASRKAFGAIWLDTQYKRGTFIREHLDLLCGMVEDAIPPWLIPFIQG